MNVPYKVVMSRSTLGSMPTGWLCMLDTSHEDADATLAHYPKIEFALGSGDTEDAATADFFKQCDKIGQDESS